MICPKRKNLLWLPPWDSESKAWLNSQWVGAPVSLFIDSTNFHQHIPGENVSP